MLFTVPSLAIFGILIVLLSPVKLGIGKFPAIIALLIYSLLPITRNTYTALKQIDPAIIEQAEGMAFTRNRIILNIMMPFSIPLIMSGIRNSFIVGVGVATISHLIGAGGIGYFIFEGIARTNRSTTLAVTFIVSLLGISLNYLLLLFEKIIIPRGLRERK